MPTIKKRSTKQTHHGEEDFKSIMHHVVDFYQDYRRQFNIGAAVIAGLVLIYGVYAFYMSSMEKKAARMLTAAYEHYSATSGAPADYKKALDGFKEISAKYPGTMSGAMAQYYAGNSLANMGQPQEALKEYEAFIKDHSGEKVLLGLVYQRMGYVYEGLGRQDDAVKAFEQAEKLLGAGAATVELARFYERSGNLGKANEKYKEITEKIPATTWAMEARTKLPPPVIAPPAATGATGTK